MKEVEVLFALRSDGSKLYDISKKGNVLKPNDQLGFSITPPINKDSAIEIKDGVSHPIVYNLDINPQMKALQAPFFYINKDIPWTCCSWVKVTSTQPYGTLFNGGRARSYQRLSLFCGNTDVNRPVDGQ